ILYFSLYYGLRFVNWLKKQSKFEKLQKKKSIETPTPVEIISEKQDISSEKQDISSIIEGIKSKTITLRDIDWKSLSPEERHEIVKSLRNK
ncbi:MAG: hypothetical protein KQA41_04785, partial [Candidatus Aenigmarchaeota archaeon]|nr:hypothetical protein [Candidatus Aenigmarchaeota archaeon]